MLRKFRASLPGFSLLFVMGCALAAAEPQHLPNLTFQNLTASKEKIGDLQGSIAVVNFWATWCAPCRAETPGLVDLQAKYRDQGLQILGISISDTVEQLPPFAKAFNINYPLLVGTEHDELIQSYGATVAIPVTVLVGRNGKMCQRHMGLVDLDEVERQIKALL
jgi:thiol-disulfide isomerase/thioredoxin